MQSQNVPIIIISRALTYDVLSHGHVTSSSQKFENGLVKAISATADVTVINVGGNSAHQGITTNGIKFLQSSYSGLFRAVRKAAGDSRAVVISTGYDPVIMSVLVLCRLLRLRVFTFIYDTHKIAMQNRKHPRKAAIGIYFGTGFFIARLVNGWIVLNDRFVLASRLFTPRYLKTRIGVEPHTAAPTSQNIGDKQVLVFAGTLNADNGAKILIQAIEQMPDRNFELHVYGYGQLENLIKDAAKRDDRIVFHGRTDNAEVVEMQMRADALVHLRDPASLASNYSYPSKLIEYLWSGRPVVSNLFPGIGDAASHIIEIDRFDSDSIAKTLSGILDRSVPLPASDGVRSQLLAQQGWPVVAAEVLDFVTDQRTNEATISEVAT